MLRKCNKIIQTTKEMASMLCHQLLEIWHSLSHLQKITQYHRMTGKTALLVPSCDHAGIATQVTIFAIVYG